MSRLSKVLSAGPSRKAWSEPPFWAQQILAGSTPLTGNHERIEGSFDAYVQRGYKSNGIIFACILARLLPFSEARFQFQQMNDGRPGDLSGGPGLDLLDNPWPNGTTGELLARMEQDASIAGNFYATTTGTGTDRRIRRLRPDWVTIVSGVHGDPDSTLAHEIESEVIGYIYRPNGTADKRRHVLLKPSEVVHWSPIPDPMHHWRGMSWLTPVINEIQADSAATKHKLKFFENGATPNVVVTYDPSVTPDQFKTFTKAFDEGHRGIENAYKTIHLGGGADASVIGADMKQLDFKATQGAGETRIAAAAGVGAIIARLSEGMQGSSLNQGNYGAAKRQFADMTLRPLWRSASASLAKLVDVPGGSRLWYDARDVAFLAEDAKDAAEIESVKATTIRTLVDGGFTPESVVAAVNAQDTTLLVHTGNLSVQLIPPGTSAAP